VPDLATTTTLLLLAYGLVGLGYYTSIGGDPSWREYSVLRVFYAAFWLPILLMLGGLTLLGIGEWIRGSVD